MRGSFTTKSTDVYSVGGHMKDRRLKLGADTGQLTFTPIGRRNDNWGETDIKNLEIRIDDEAPLSKVRESIIHELMHVGDMMGVAEDALTENEVRRVSTWLAAFFHDNPWLKEVLFG